MEYRVYGNDVVLRIQKGEEILTCLKEVCEKEHITLGSVTGLGAVGEVTLGVFNRENFAYEKQTYTGDMEIASCVGNISTMEARTICTSTWSWATSRTASATPDILTRCRCQPDRRFILHKIEGTVEREYSPEVGLNLFKFVD